MWANVLLGAANVALLAFNGGSAQRRNGAVWSRFFGLSFLVLLYAGFPPGATAHSSDDPASVGDKEAKPPYKATIDFDNFESGKVPAGFLPILAGGGEQISSWVVKEEPSAPSGTKVLAQTSSDPLGSRFPVCLYKKLTAQDVEVSVQFKTVSGKIDQVAGLVARFQDPDHYYVVRANAFENSIKLYKVVDGNSEPLAEGSVAVPSGTWHTLKLVAKDSHFQVFFNGTPLFEADDDTFKQAGKVGLSTKADSVTVFDNLQIESHDPNWTEEQTKAGTQFGASLPD